MEHHKAVWWKHASLDSGRRQSTDRQLSHRRSADTVHSFWPVPVYAILWLGYRVRMENSEQFIDPGNEFVFLGEAGVNPTPDTFLKATFDGFRGERREVDGILTGTQRRIATLQFTGAVRTGPVWPEVAVRIPISGQEFPAGVQFVFGASAQIR